MGSVYYSALVKCPKCGTNVMETGWTETRITTENFMRFRGRGASMIASTEWVADKVTCMCCNAVLKLTAAEMMGLAA